VTDATELLEDILKSLLSSNENIKESKLREVMQVLLVLPTFWPTGISPILVLWEVFLQRINSFFVLESETPSATAVIGYVNKIHHFIFLTINYYYTDIFICLLQILQANQTKYYWHLLTIKFN
jgi:hypothetical protein